MWKNKNIEDRHGNILLKTTLFARPTENLNVPNFFYNAFNSLTKTEIIKENNLAVTYI